MAHTSGPAAAAAVRFCVMGSIRLTIEGRPVSVGSRVRALLATLALADGVLSKEKVATSMWPESPTPQCLGNLRNVLYFLRKEHPELTGILQVNGEQLRLGELEVDLWTLRELLRTPDVPTHAVVEVYAGHLASELDGAAAAALRQSLASGFFVWASERLSRLEESRQFDAALRLADHVLRVEPYHEPTYRAVMRLHAALGDTPLALRAYETCREALAEGVGESPSRETRALARRIKEHQTLPPPTPKATGTTMIGRIIEWRQLTEAWKACLGGRSAVHDLEGLSGIGKTRLMEEFASHLKRQGHRALLVQCLELQTHTPFAVLMAVMEQLERAAQPGAARRETSSDALQEALRTPPQLLQLQLQQRATHLLRQGLPCCLIVDDAQWCDPETLAWLQDATVTLAPEAILWIFSHTPLTSKAPLRRLLNSVARSERFLPMELGGLSPQDSAQLAQLYGAGHVDALVTLSEGSPLAITQLVSHRWQHDQPLPLTLAAAFERQLAQAGDAHQLAAVMAIAERPLSLRFLDALEMPEVEGHLDALLALRLVEERADGTVRLVHGLFQKHVLGRLRGLTLRRLKGIVGKAWMRMTSPEAPPEQVAENLEAGGLDAEAASFYLQAVGPLVLRGRFDLAHGYAERAEALATRTRQHALAWQAASQLASTALAACDAPRLLQALSRMEAHIASAPEREASIRLELFRVELWFMQGDLAETADGYLRLLEHLNECHEPALACRLATQVLRFFLRMREFLPDRGETVSIQHLLNSCARLRQALPLEIQPKLRSALAHVVWSENLALHEPKLLLQLRDALGTEVLQHTESVSRAWMPLNTSTHPDTADAGRTPFEQTKEILTRLSRISDVNDRLILLEHETSSAYHQRQFSLVLFLCLGSKQILERRSHHTVRTIAQMTEVATYRSIGHHRRGLALAEALTARAFPKGCAVVESFFCAHRAWMLLALQERDAFFSVLDRLNELSVSVAPHHPQLMTESSRLNQEAAMLRGDIAAALEAHERFHRWLQENAAPEQAWRHVFYGHCLRIWSGQPSMGGEQLKAVMDQFLSRLCHPHDHNAWLLGLVARAYAEEGQHSLADLYRQQAADSFDQSLQRLAPSHRLMFANFRAASLEGRRPRPEELSREYVTTLTDEEQLIADNAVRWISGG